MAKHFEVFCGENDLAINPRKTKCMLINCEGTISVNSEEIEEVDSFRYLGLVLAADGKDPTSILLDRI
jgi:hypothetical protein